jgi:hypothetical protein
MHWMIGGSIPGSGKMMMMMMMIIIIIIITIISFYPSVNSGLTYELMTAVSCGGKVILNLVA